MEDKNFEIDDTAFAAVQVPKDERVETQQKSERKKVKRVVQEDVDDTPISCLRNEKIIVKYVPKENSRITDKKHPWSGDFTENSSITYTVPMLSNGSYKNVLTKDEKDFLEDYMGLEVNALSVYNKRDNYWENYFVKLTKHDTILDLTNPNDYIKYKVLLANKDYIAPSVKDLRENYRATYRFVITSNSETFSTTKETVSSKMRCYAELSKIIDNYDILKAVVESVDGRPISLNSDIEFIKSKALTLLESDTKDLLNALTDKYLPYRVIINKAASKKIIQKRGDYYYYNDEPMCMDGENPTITYAARYLALPQNQELKFTIEAKLK